MHFYYIAKSAFSDSNCNLKVFKIVKIIVRPTILGLKVKSVMIMIYKFY